MKKSITLIMLLFLLLTLSACGSNASSKSQTASTPPIEVKTEEIIDDYIRDQASAEQKYKDKNVKLTGKVIRKGQFENTSHFFINTGIKHASGKTYIMMVDYPTDKVNDVNSVKVDDFLVVEGKVVGIVPQKDPTIISIQMHVNSK